MQLNTILLDVEDKSFLTYVSPPDMKIKTYIDSCECFDARHAPSMCFTPYCGTLPYLLCKTPPDSSLTLLETCSLKQD